MIFNSIGSSTKQFILRLLLTVSLLFILHVLLIGILIWRHERSASTRPPVFLLLEELPQELTRQYPDDNKGTWIVMKAMPGRIILVVLCDLILFFLIFYFIDRRSLRASSRVLSGIRSLSDGEPVQLKEEGALSEISAQLNKTSDLLKARAVAQENWIAGISHDIRTPLSVIVGYAEKMETNTSLPEGVQEQASLIKTQGIRLRNLVNDLNLIARLGDGAQPLQGKLFYPAGFCREIIAEFINNGEPDGYSVELDVDEDMERVVVWGDQHLLRRAIGNLLHNSIRHNPGGCDVRLRLCGKDRMVLFVVSDNGKGMTLGEIDLLQTRSHYLSDAASDFDGRHGLGLYIVQQIVKMHSGHTAFAKSESGGLKVTIELPMA